MPVDFQDRERRHRQTHQRQLEAQGREWTEE